MPCKGDRKKFPLTFGKSASCPWRASEKKFSKIPAYSGLRGVVRNEGEFLQINVHFAFCGFVCIRGEMFPQLCRIPAPSAWGIRKFHEIFSLERNKPAANSRIVSEQTTQRSFLERDSTTVPNFAYRLILSYGNLVGVATICTNLIILP